MPDLENMRAFKNCHLPFSAKVTQADCIVEMGVVVEKTLLPTFTPVKLRCRLSQFEVKLYIHALLHFAVTRILTLTALDWSQRVTLHHFRDLDDRGH